MHHWGYAIIQPLFVPVLRNHFPGLFQDSDRFFQDSKIYINPRSQHCRQILFVLLLFNRFSDLSRTSNLFPGLFGPEKCHNKIIGPSWFSRTWKKTCPYFLLWPTGWTTETHLIYFELDHNYIFKYQIIFSMRSLFLCRVEIYTSKGRVVFEVCKAKIYPVAGINFNIQVTIIYYERKKKQGMFS